MTSGFCWSHGSVDVADYIDFWIANIKTTRAVRRDDWHKEWARLEALRIVAPGDWPEFDRRFVQTKIGKAYPRPGLCCQYTWPLDTAIALDDAGRFVESVRAAISALLLQLEEECSLPQQEH